MPAKTLNNAATTINAAKATEQSRVNALATGEEPEERKSAPPKAAAQKPAAAVTSTSQIAPGITATTSIADVAGDASPAFKAWVAQAKISGVFHGSPARALVNGRTFRSGQVADETLGITFDHLDDETKSIVFKDRTGATVARRY